MTNRSLLGPLALLGVLACSSDEGEPDNARTVYELELPRTGAGLALVEVDDGVMMVVGPRLLHVAKGTDAVTTIHESTRIHSSLGIDPTYVYFATQSARIHYATHTPSTEPDGYMYRVQRRAPFAAEKLAPVGILTGRIEVKGGALYVCTSHGINGDGGVFAMATVAPQRASEVSVGYNQFCQGVVATDERTVYVAIDRSHSSKKVAGDGLVLATLTATIKDLAVTDVKGIHDLVLRNDELVLLSGTDATFVSKEGKVRDTMRTGTRGLLAPLGEAGWAWSKDSDRSEQLGRICREGRLYAGTTAATGRELTQNVCYVRAIMQGTSGLWFLEYADIIATGGPGTLRYRLKLLPTPQL